MRSDLADLRAYANLSSFNATQKTALAQGIFHYLVREYITCVYRFLPAEEASNKMHELLNASVEDDCGPRRCKLPNADPVFSDSALESLPDIVHTKDGSAVVRELIVRGNAKV